MGGKNELETYCSAKNNVIISSDHMNREIDQRERNSTYPSRQALVGRKAESFSRQLSPLIIFCL